MRVLLFSLMLVTLSGVFLGQTQQPDTESTVRQALKSVSQGTYTSTEQKELGWLGDASAVALTKILAGKILDEGDIESVLVIVQLSCEDPRIVKVDSDRQPRTTLLLLRYLDLATNDTKLKEKIATTEDYVNNHYRKSLGETRNPNTNPAR